MRCTLLVTLVLLPVCLTTAADRPAPSDSQSNRQSIEFFEKKIRPVLIKHCYECHSTRSKKIRGGLVLDSRKGLLTGGDSGPAIEPGKVNESLLIDALRYDGFEMPPKGKLSEKVISDFEEWIRLGAPDPRIGTPAVSKRSGIDIESRRAHWAYQLPKPSNLPAVHDVAWPYDTIDRYILSKLEAKGLQPVADADRIPLVRRLYFDLIGLPPTPEQIDEFVQDSSSDAYERLVDRLLASSHFGERWGRHWLDVVRYAESLTLRGFILKESWRYRDYVIESFNADHAFDRFLMEQLAGDLLNNNALDERRRNLIATTFLMMGNSNLEDQDKQQLEMDFIDEQLDVIGRGILAQTITCARCHDHKFDPIPTRDYYALAGILKNVQSLEHANVSKWIEVPLPVEEELEKQLRAGEKAITSHESRIKKLKKAIQRAAKGNTATESQILIAKNLPGIVVDDADARKIGEWTYSQFTKRYIGDGYSHDLNKGKGRKTLTFLPQLPADGIYEVRFAYTSGTNRAQDVPVTVFSADGEKTIHVNEKQQPSIDDRFLSLGRFRFEVNGQSFVIVSNEGTTGHVIADAVQFIPVKQLDTLPIKPQVKKKNTASAEVTKSQKELKKVEAELKQLRAKARKRPMVMSVIEKKISQDLPIHIRGSVHNLGEIAPRGVLQVATYGTPPKMPDEESGRLQLAEWIVSPHNPLTARVMVNRVWHWLFGQGLVRTVDNFGTTGEHPSHAKLLDHLALQFVEEDWSIKKLVRKMILSRTYRLSTAVESKALIVDPENRLLSRMNRRRLDAECLRDSMLAISGTLTLNTGGPSFKENLASDYGFHYTGTRRSVYAPVFRNSLPELFKVFDFANPSMVTGRRDVSTVAPQALFLMNHPFVIEQSRQAAIRMVKGTPGNDETKIRRAYRLALGRFPAGKELKIAVEFVQDSPSESLESQIALWTQFYQSLFASIDFRYLR
jgi:hypothetical protein